MLFISMAVRHFFRKGLLGIGWTKLESKSAIAQNVDPVIDRALLLQCAVGDING
jgi:hypothetical protein